MIEINRGFSGCLLSRTECQVCGWNPVYSAARATRLVISRTGSRCSLAVDPGREHQRCLGDRLDGR